MDQIVFRSCIFLPTGAKCKVSVSEMFSMSIIQSHLYTHSRIYRLRYYFNKNILSAKYETLDFGPRCQENRACLRHSHRGVHAPFPNFLDTPIIYELLKRLNLMYQSHDESSLNLKKNPNPFHITGFKLRISSEDWTQGRRNVASRGGPEMREKGI